ncbi:MAG: hypothetical protein A2Y41_07285 [Spirochaetes bacterium GWB1_36_13]|nr:MAG: hypothetical protein A2Y41_07285 [Spirochaetes bacterium GWB1_36_13]
MKAQSIFNSFSIKTPSFLSGFFYFPSIDYHISINNRKTDSENIYSDFQAVGNDIRTAINKYAQTK